MMPRLARCAALLTVILGVASAPSAWATTEGPSTLAFGFTPSTPATSAAMSVHVVYRAPGDPEGKPPPLDGLRLAAPTGTRFDPTAVPICAASDVQLRLFGRGACPPGSQIGAGRLVAVTGFGAPVDPFPTVVAVFNGAAGPIEVVELPGTGIVLGIDRMTIEGSTLVAHPPVTPGGPPDGRTAIREVELGFTNTGYVTTPGSCPSSKRWTARATIDFADGTTQTATATTACRPA